MQCPWVCAWLSEWSLGSGHGALHHDRICQGGISCVSTFRICSGRKTAIVQRFCMVLCLCRSDTSRKLFVYTTVDHTARAPTAASSASTSFALKAPCSDLEPRHAGHRAGGKTVVNAGWQKRGVSPANGDSRQHRSCHITVAMGGLASRRPTT